MKTQVRSKSKPKKDAAKKEELKTGIRIRIEDLRVGDRIVTSWHTRAEAAGRDGRQLTMDEVMDVLADGEGRYVNRSVEVKQFTECPGMWRTHVHVNKSMCYDMRGMIWIVAQ